MYVYMLLGSHENEQKGASGDHTSKPYFLGIQQPNQASGVPGAVGASTYFPSSDELEGKMRLDMEHQSKGGVRQMQTADLQTSRPGTL